MTKITSIARLYNYPITKVKRSDAVYSDTVDLGLFIDKIKKELTKYDYYIIMQNRSDVIDENFTDQITGDVLYSDGMIQTPVGNYFMNFPSYGPLLESINLQPSLIVSANALHAISSEVKTTKDIMNQLSKAVNIIHIPEAYFSYVTG